MLKMTTKDIIHSYSRMVRDGLSDTDLTKRQRQYLHVLLNLASNDARAWVEYPPSGDIRAQLCRSMGADSQNVRFFLNTPQETDFDAAQSRAVEVLRNF